MRAAYEARGSTCPGVEEVGLLHQLGLALGCSRPRRLDEANQQYELALRLLREADGELSLRTLPILASWTDCALARRAGAEGAQRALIDRALSQLRHDTAPVLDRAEALILGGEPGAVSHFSGAYTLLQKLGEEQRALRLLHAVSPAWDPGRK